MKKLLMVLLVSIPGYAFALDCSNTSDAEVVKETTEITTDVPSHLRGAVIVVRLSDGRETTVPAEKFKVVPRKQQFIVAKTYQLNRQVCTPDKNRLSLLAGKGPQNSLDVDKTGSKVTVETDYGAVGGLQYQRMVNDDISIGIQGQTNESILLNVGLDF